MANKDKSFTINIIPRDATRNRREWIVSGKKLVFFRVLVVVLLLVMAGSVFIIFAGTAEAVRTASLIEQNGLLTDSLAIARELNSRLDNIELELQEIRETRTVIENLATAGASREDSE